MDVMEQGQLWQERKRLPRNGFVTKFGICEDTQAHLLLLRASMLDLLEFHSLRGWDDGTYGNLGSAR